MFNLYRFRCIKRFSKQEINIMLFASIYIFFQNKKHFIHFFLCFQKGFPYIQEDYEYSHSHAGDKSKFFPAILKSFPIFVSKK